MRHPVVWATVVMVTFGVTAHSEDVGYSYDFSSLLRIDLATGNVAPVGDPTYLPGGVRYFALDTGGHLFGLSWNDELMSFDTSTGAVETHGTVTVPAGQFPDGLEFDLSGRLLLLAQSHPQSALYEVDPATAATTFLIWIDGDDIHGLAISARGAYAVRRGHSISEIDLATGSVTDLPGDGGNTFTSIDDLSFDGRGRLWAIEQLVGPVPPCQANTLVRFDLTTGDYAPMAPIPAGSPPTCLPALAIESMPADPAIPILGPVGLMASVVLVVAAGVALLYFRRSSAAP